MTRVTSPIVAAGAVVWRQRDMTLEICVIHRPRYDDWTLPKGKVDDGEHVLACAVREVNEETGYQVTLGRPMPTQRYLASGRPKIVYYWAAKATERKSWQPTDEVDDVVFVPASEAVRMLTHSHDADLVTSLASGLLRSRPLVLLRHTAAVERAEWDGPEQERPLTARGTTEANELVPPLAALGLTRVVSSDAARCADTVRPYASWHGSTVELEPALSEEAHASGSDRILPLMQKWLADGEPTVICSHRLVLPDLLAAAEEHARCALPTDPLPPGAFHVLHHWDGDVIDVETFT